MQESIIPLLTSTMILGIITLLFFVNEFFRKYKIVKKQKTRKRKRVQKLQPTIQDVENVINLQPRQWEEIYKDKHSRVIMTHQTI